MDFESYLTSKRIDSARFKTAEPDVWQSWRTDFEQMHPNSFTVQKLNLINPVRRKYQLIVAEVPKAATSPVPKTATSSAPKTAMPPPPKVAAPSSLNIGTAGVPDVDAPAAPPTPVAKPAVRIPRPGMPKIVKPGGAATEPPSLVESPVINRPSPADEPPSLVESPSSVASPDTIKPSAADQSPAIGSNQNTTGVNQSATSVDASSTKDVSSEQKDETKSVASNAPAAKPARPVIPRPIIKPKPKTD